MRSLLHSSFTVTHSTVPGTQGPLHKCLLMFPAPSRLSDRQRKLSNPRAHTCPLRGKEAAGLYRTLCLPQGAASEGARHLSAFPALCSAGSVGAASLAQSWPDTKGRMSRPHSGSISLCLGKQERVHASVCVCACVCMLKCNECVRACSAISPCPGITSHRGEGPAQRKALD